MACRRVVGGATMHDLTDRVDLQQGSLAVHQDLPLIHGPTVERFLAQVVHATAFGLTPENLLHLGR